MSAARRSRRRLLAQLAVPTLLVSGVGGLLAGAADVGASRLAVGAMVGGLGMAAAMPIFGAFLHQGVGNDRSSRRRFVGVTHLVSAAGALAAVVGTLLVTGSLWWTLSMTAVLVVLTGVLTWTHRRLAAIGRMEDAEAPGTPSVTQPLDESLLPDAVRRLRRRVLLVGLSVGLPAALALLVGVAVNGSPGPREALLVLFGGGFLGGLAATCVGAFSQSATLRAPLRAAGGDGRLAREVTAAIRRRRVDRLGADRAAWAVPVARALDASYARQTPGSVALLVLLVSGFGMQLTREPMDTLLLAVSGAGAALPIVLLAWSRRERRLLSRFLAQHDPDHQPHRGTDRRSTR